MFSRNTLLLGLVAWLSGLLFGFGLIISGMANPAKVLNFLDIFGHWDPSLAFVMGGAVVVTLVGFRVVSDQAKPVLLPSFQLPTRQDIDKPLIVGAILFGLGWGIGGYCPGPAWTALSAFAPGTVVFLAAMLIGMSLATLFKKRLT